MKIRPIGAELFHGTDGWRADGRIDLTKLVVAFSNFANASKNCGGMFTEWKLIKLVKITDWNPTGTRTKGRPKNRRRNDVKMLELRKWIQLAKDKKI
jgi:hypothetical protein